MRYLLMLIAASTLGFMAALSAGTAAFAEELTIQVRTIDDPSVEPDLDLCDRAPFPINAVFGASAWSLAARASDGAVVNEQIQQVGTATACMLVTDPTFAPGSEILLFGSFEVDQGSFVGQGKCLVTSNEFPRPGAVLAGCTAGGIEAPPGFTGGIAGSATILNPLNLPDVQTGSYWTIRFFTE
jgi:hypothetical protein